MILDRTVSGLGERLVLEDRTALECLSQQRFHVRSVKREHRVGYLIRDGHLRTLLLSKHDL